MNKPASIILSTLALAVSVATTGCQQAGTQLPATPVVASASTSSEPAGSSTAKPGTAKADDTTDNQSTFGEGPLVWRDVDEATSNEASRRCQTWVGDPAAIARAFKEGHTGKYRMLGGRAGDIFGCIVTDPQTGMTFAININLVQKVKPCGDNVQCLADDMYQMDWFTNMTPKSQVALDLTMKAAFTRIER